jgi:hypothetical protein
LELPDLSALTVNLRAHAFYFRPNMFDVWSGPQSKVA